MKNSLRKAWYGKTLTEEDYYNLCDLMLIATVIMILNLIIF